MKVLVGLSPSGLVMFVFELWGRHISDRNITVQCGLLDRLEHGDAVMADKGFVIEDLLIPFSVRLNIPPFNTKAHQMLLDVVTTQHIAAVCIHVERAIGRIKHYRLLDGVIDNNLCDLLEQLFFIAAMLSNFQPPLVAL